MIFLISKYYYGDQIKQQVGYMSNNRYTYRILEGGGPEGMCLKKA